jgi:hypothetical protein
MWKKKGEPKPCGLRMADGTPCVLDSGHDPEKSWETREHKTADGTVFTWRSGQCAEQFRLINQLRLGASWQI